MMDDVRTFPSDVTLLLCLLATTVGLNVAVVMDWWAYDSLPALLWGVGEKVVIIYGVALLYWGYAFRWRVRRAVPLEGTPFTEAAAVVRELVGRTEIVVWCGPWLGRRAFVAGGHGVAVLVMGPELLGLCTASAEGRAVFEAVVRHEIAHVRAGDLGWYQLGSLLRVSVLPTALLLLVQVRLGWVYPIVPVDGMIRGFLAQVVVVELVARAFLRAREHQADLIAARDGSEGLLAAVGTAPAVRPWLRRHPGGAARTAVLGDPGRLPASAPGRLLLGATIAGIAMGPVQLMVNAVSRTLGTEPHYLVLTAITGVLVGVPLTAFAAFGIWRSTWHTGPRPFRSAAALCAGVVLGNVVAPLPGVVHPLPTVLAAYALGSVALCLGIAWVGRALARADPAARRARTFLRVAVPVTCLVGGALFAALACFASLRYLAYLTAV